MRVRRQLIHEVVNREQEIARREGLAKRPQIQSTHVLQGLSRSGAIQLALYENGLQAVERVLRRRVELEEEVSLTLEDIADIAWLKDAENDIQALVHEEFEWLEGQAKEYANRHGAGLHDFEHVFKEQLEKDRRRLLDFYVRELRILQRKRLLTEKVGRPEQDTEQMEPQRKAEWPVSDVEPKPEECDAVTQLYARRIFNQDLPCWIKFSEDQGLPVSCLVLDVDDFRSINNAYGHDKGDEVLRKVAMQLRSIVRGKGRAYRWGSGDELVALLMNHTPGEALATAERLRSVVTELAFEGIDHAITLSVGVATYPDLAANPDQLRTHADEALRMAKDAGKDQARVYPDPHASVTTEVWPRASEEEIANVLRYTTSSSVDVRRDAAKELLALAHRKQLSHSEELLTVVEGLLSDPDEEVRGTALQVVVLMIHVAMTPGMESESASALIDRYYQILLKLAQSDPSFTVRAQAIAAIGSTGSPKFIENILKWIRTWDRQAYVAVCPYVALTGLAMAGLGAQVRGKLRDALEKEESEDVKQRLRECLREVSSVIR